MIKGILFDFGDTIVVEPDDIATPILEARLSVVPSASAVLESLSKRFSLAIVSNTTTSGDDEIAEALRRVGLLHHFSTVVTSVTVGIAKPEPGIYLEALRRMDLEPRHAVMVGDRVDTDILGANRLGIPSILHRWNDRYPHLDQLPEQAPTLSIRHLSELEEALTALMLSEKAGLTESEL